MQDGKDESANQGTALWRKPKSEITPEQYEEFYRSVGMNFDKPWATLHWRAEGQLEFSALLFVPGMKPFQAVDNDRQSKVRLHVRRMFITDEAELLPSWLRFVQGVVDTEDLPLNVSREMLQSTPALAKIRRAVTGRVISELTTRAKDADAYQKFWENFGPVLKEGIYEDFERRAEIAALLRFRSSAVEGWTSLADYVARMKDGQESIFYLVADDAEALKSSAQLEGFRARGLEVLLLSDHVDAFWPDQLRTFEDKSLRSITQGTLDLSKFTPEGGEPEAPEGIAAFVAAVKTALGADVSDVRTTDRLVDSAVVLSSGTGGPDLQMQRLMRRAGRAGAGQPVLEINPRHPLIRALAEAPESEVPDAAGASSNSRRCWTSPASRTVIARAILRRSRAPSPRRWRPRAGCKRAKVPVWLIIPKRAGHNFATCRAQSWR